MKAMMAKMIKMQESLQSFPAVTCGKLGEKINIYHPTSLLKSIHYRMADAKRAKMTSLFVSRNFIFSFIKFHFNF